MVSSLDARLLDASIDAASQCRNRGTGSQERRNIGKREQTVPPARVSSP
jgi:hypothetical protein